MTRTIGVDAVRSVGRSIKKAFGIFSTKSFALLAASFSLLSFHVRAYLFWFPTMILVAWTEVPEAFLGLSYTTIITLISLLKVVGMLIGLPFFLWIAQSWRHATGPFSGRKGFTRAYPVVVSVGAWVNSSMYIVLFLCIVENFTIAAVALFFVSFAAAADASLSQQMVLMVVPSHSRAAAVALFRLISGIVVTPAAQLIGMISDAARGDSTLPYDRFHAYQLAMLCSASFSFASSICDLVLIFFFSDDCENAEMKNREEETIDERTSLLGETKMRTESLLDTIV